MAGTSRRPNVVTPQCRDVESTYKEVNKLQRRDVESTYKEVNKLQRCNVSASYSSQSLKAKGGPEFKGGSEIEERMNEGMEITAAEL